ncbi:hypothetical protein E4N82_08990 [Treponema denticola]|uniref:hypothetical protein n=1 Tax=Treponema denticola TaxID=158 RepID=UPI004037C669
MLAMQYQEIEVFAYKGEIISTLSDGRKVKQPFKWSIENGELEVEYSEDISEMDIIGIDREYTDEELTALDTCIVEKSELEYRILESYDYKEALEEYKASRNLYSYYGVSPRDFFSK